MLETCSPHREGSSPVHLHSPHRLRYYDSHLALGEIQRSLSRSPSKTADFRHSLRSHSPSVGNTPNHPSPLSPSRRSTSDLFLTNSAMSSPFAGRNGPARQNRPSLRRTAQASNNLRGRTSPKSPSKKILVDSSDSGNSTPAALRKRSSTEAEREQGLRNAAFGGNDKENSSSQEEALGSRHVYTRQEKRRSGGSLMSFIPPQSPMKRPEPMALDHMEIQSPSAKRRSLHGPSTGLDFSIFESESPNKNSSQDDNDWLRNATPAKYSTIPRRSTSLRKSTIQQRQSDRSSIKFSQPSEPGSWFDSTPLARNDKSFRMSLDNHLAPMPRESPFSAQGHLISASIHPATSANNSQVDNGALHARHPLSRTMTQSSQSSVQEESPTHEAFHRPFKPASFDFSKSLPIGSTRPTPSRGSSQHFSQGSFATPATYKSAKPLPAAFMSTGLISKKNRNVDDPNAGIPKAHMPDTPCKKQSVMFPPDVKPIAGRNRVSFGTPATPTEHQAIRPLPFAKSVGLFGTRSSKPSLMRKASFASIDFDDKGSSQSPTQRNASQSTTESDLPPTPTKHFDEPSRGSSISPSPHHGRHLSVPILSGSQFASSKLSPIKQSPESVDGDSEGMMLESPSASLSPKTIRKASRMSTSFTRTRACKDLSSPTPLTRCTLVLSSRNSPALKHAKHECVSPVTPLGDRSESRFSPHTPQDSVFPPDPSGLSISGRGDRSTIRNGIASAVPATPTGPRDYFPNFSNRPSLDLNSAQVTSVDCSLLARFEKVDLIGTGEFSQVYRVSKPPRTSPLHKIYASSTPRQERVWAVKKSRHPYTGPKDRQRKLKEAETLKVLGRSDHVVGFVDSWENENHLYIQTEFCEEGTLGSFIDQKGSKARLDDFRIWKIMLELSQGLKHIHEQGYVHLDLKPANVLVSFEGVLKIADFGMATKWPAEPGIEGEGDREYIAPEILEGKYDKPADVFSLGLMMLEIAGNVVLPDNGMSWQKLRNGDLSDITTLSWDSESSIFSRDASGNPVEGPVLTEVDTAMDIAEDGIRKRPSLPPARPGELALPPAFMLDRTHPDSLDSVVTRMLIPSPTERPVITQILRAEGLRFVNARRRAGATVYEGNWGPADEVLAEDAEMIDV